MKYLLTVSVLKAILNPQKDERPIVDSLEALLENNDKFFTTALSIFEVLENSEWESGVDRKEFLHQTGILCEEIFPVSKEDLTLYSNLSHELESYGLEIVELSVAINRGIETLLVYESKLIQNHWIEVKDLAKES